MSQTYLFLALHLVGVAITLAVGPRSRVALCCALGFPVGLAVMVSLVLAMAAIGIPYTLVTGSLLAAAVVAAGLAALARRGWPDARAWRVVALWTLGFTAVCVPVTYVNLSLLTYDSHMMVMLGRAVFEDHGFAPGVVTTISDWGIFQFIAHSGIGFTGASYLYSLATVLGLSTVAFFAVALRHVLDTLGVPAGRGRGLFIALMTAIAFTMPMTLHHFFYIHSNLGTAVYMLVFAVMFWLGENDDRGAFPIAFIALFALALHRIENPIIATLLLCLTLLQSRAPRRDLLPGLTVYTVAVIAWYLYLSTETTRDSIFLTPTKCYILAGGTLIFYLYALASWQWPLRFVQALHRAVPALLVIACGLAIVAAFVKMPAHMMESLEACDVNMRTGPHWGGVSLGLVVLAVLGLFVPGPRFKQVFVYGIPLYIELILLLGAGRSPYRAGWDDSAARMSIHIAPMIVFYFGMKFGPLLFAPRATPR
jgi:hypothetical protein